MTFFILRLTFATNEPAQFETMKVTMFGGGGARGVFAESPDGLDKSTIAARIRPRAARLTIHGSEMPPIEKEASQQTVANAMSGLEEEKHREVVDVYPIVVGLSEFVSAAGEVTCSGRQHLKMLAKQIRNLPYAVIFESSSELTSIAW